MKTRLTLLHALVALSLLLSLAVVPVSGQSDAPQGSAARAAGPQTQDTVPEPSAPVDPDIRSPRPKPRSRPIPTGAIGPIATGPYVTEAVAGSFDGDLRDLEPAKAVSAATVRETHAPLETRDFFNDLAYNPEFFDAGVVQRAPGAANMPAPLITFGGQYGAEAGGYLPPDTVGDVGPNHYVQYVNTTFSIYNKVTGARIVGPLQLSDLFNASQAPCNVVDDGDPIVLYDSMADRWLLTQFAVPGPYYQCIALSKTGDPVSGGWWTYAFPASTPEIDGLDTALNDYPKLSVWPDAYYMTANMFPDTNIPGYVRVWALNRSRMLAGQSLQSVSFDLSDTSSVLASNQLGDSPPPGSPAFLMAVQAPDKLNFWRFKVDWDAPENSTLTGPTSMSIAPYAPVCDGRNCVPQLGTAQGVDALSPRLMYNLQYRRVGSTESLWVNHTITNSGKAAVRWYEVRLTRAGDLITPTLYQQSTYNPSDGVWRWMGSIAADRMGNAALGYSASSPTIYPGIRYVGRLVTDTLNLMGQSEYTMTVGNGAQTHTAARWGDYSSMNVDPVDDCTFWYTTEYFTATSTANWSTRIGSFKYDSCVPLPANGTITGTVYNSVTLAVIPNMPVMAINDTFTRTYAASTDVNGVFTMTVQPGTYTVTAGPLEPNYPVENSAAAPVVITSGGSGSVTIGLQPFPNLVNANVVINDPGPLANANGYVEPGEENLQVFETISNTGLFTATNVTAQLIALTPGVTVVTPTASYGDIVAGAAATNATPFGFSVDGGVACGATLSFMKVITADQRVFTETFSVVAQIPAVVLPTVYTYVSSDVPKPIPDNNLVGVTSTVSVPDSFQLGKAVVSLSLNHTWDSDVGIYLRNPSGGEIALSVANGSNGDNYTNTIFDDDAPTSITAGAPPFTGMFRPEQPLSTFQFTPTSGTWGLRLNDSASQDTGTLITWTLKLQPGIPAYCAWPVPDLNLINTQVNDGGNQVIEPGDASVDLLAALQNTGTLTATSVNATLTPQTPGVTMNTAASAYADINVGAVQTNTTPFNFAVDSNFVCGLPIDFDLSAVTQRGTFNHDIRVPTGQGPVGSFVLFDNVENGQGGWTTGSTYTGWEWTITTEDSNSPTHAWTDSPGAQYPPGASTWLESPQYDFSAYDAVTLSFWHKYSTEAGYDYGFVEVSTDGGLTWSQPLAAYDGVQNTWTQATVNLTPLAHAANARFRFRFFSDPGVLDDGWTIDDIQVTGQKRVCAPIESLWLKEVSVNGVITTANPINLAPNDVVQVVDRVWVTATGSVTFTLTENWTALLSLSGYSASAGTVLTTPSSLIWSANGVAANAYHVLTKTFTVGSTPFTASLTEQLLVEDALPPQPDRVLNFNLAAPTIGVTPASLSSTQGANQTVTQSLTINNTGNAPLNWTVFENPGSAPQVDAPAGLFQPIGPEMFDRGRASADTRTDVKAERIIAATTPALAPTGFSENFDNVAGLPAAGWWQINRSDPLGGTGWFQGNPAVFPAHQGASNSYIGANYNNTGNIGTISNWLLTPETTIRNGDTLLFYTRVPTNSQFPDRLEVRLSSSGAITDVGINATSVGVFNTLLTSINPNLVVGGYPDQWSPISVTVSGLAGPVQGRFGLRYYVDDAGASGANSNYIGIDTLSYTTLCSSPNDVPWLNLSPTSGSTAAGGSSTVNVGTNSTGLSAGTYTANVCVTSNDPLTSLVIVPVTLTVTPEITFVYHDLEDVVHTGEDVTLAGSFNGWNNSVLTMTHDAGYTTFTATLSLAAGSYDYKYVVKSGGDQWDWLNTNNRAIVVSGAATRHDYRNVTPGYMHIMSAASIAGQQNVPVGPLVGEAYYQGVTNDAGSGRGLIYQVGYGLTTTALAGWNWITATYTGQNGNNDVFESTVTVAASGVYSYAVRAEGNWGAGNPNAGWFYGDLDGVFPGEPFELDNTGLLTISPHRLFAPLLRR